MDAMGVAGIRDITPDLIFRRTGDMRVKTFAELYDYLTPGQLLDDHAIPAEWANDWKNASASAFADSATRLRLKVHAPPELSPT